MKKTTAASLSKARSNGARAYYQTPPQEQLRKPELQRDSDGAGGVSDDGSDRDYNMSSNPVRLYSVCLVVNCELLLCVTECECSDEVLISALLVRFEVLVGC